MSVFVTRSFLPPVDEYKAYVDRIWENSHLTNQGPLLQEFEAKIQTYLGVEHFHFLTNGTLALQLALSSLEIHEGEVITTPFSYVATTSSILWQRCTPVFVDIEPDNFTIDPTKIEAAITPQTKAILAVHVFGYACDVDAIQKIADKHGLKVIYDAAHAFGSVYKGKALSSYGDISTLSFHATKLFHTIEGGACIVKDAKVSENLDLQKRFGHNGDEHLCLGMNAKANEFQAAMGLTNFPYIEQIIRKRKEVSEIYDTALTDYMQLPKKQAELEYNYAYYPVIFKSEEKLLETLIRFKKQKIYPRRYFFPSLNTLPYIKYNECPEAENIAKRALCLPLHANLEKNTQKNIIREMRK